MRNKRYTSEQQILDDIEKAKRRSSEKLREAEQLEEEYAAMQRMTAKGIQIDWEAFHYIKAQIPKLRKTAASLIDVRLPKLGKKLSEFRTMTLPGMTDDESIPAKL